jgi:hypothetical protein
MVDKSVGPDATKKLLTTSDWFYSETNFNLISQYFMINNLNFD